jgi:predicted RNA-binding Zn ribbon-like protein
MTVAWTAHRFSGGVLALDAANTVVLRNDPERRFDRFDDPAEIARFAAAASVFREKEVGKPLIVQDAATSASTVRELRERIDALFRNAAGGRPLSARAMAQFLRACAGAIESAGDLELTEEAPFGTSHAPLAFEAALALSALSLLNGGGVTKLKICRHCDWLFLDRSRNSSRLWCDMAVCGNRVKAKRHYSRTRKDKEFQK